MKKLKKLVPFLTALTLLFSSAACGGGTDSVGGSSSSSLQENSSSSSDGGGSSSSSGTEAQTIIERYISENGKLVFGKYESYEKVYSLVFRHIPFIF